MRASTTDSFDASGGRSVESLVVLSLGSNLGDRRRILRDAFTALSARLAEPRLSSFYETEPLYVTDQPPFLNAAVSGTFGGSPQDLLAFIHEVEGRFGRDRSTERRRGPRTLDIDILLFGDLVVDEPPLLVIPHEGLLERAFALVPALELLPDAIDPRTRRPLSEAAAALSGRGIYLADRAPYNRV